VFAYRKNELISPQNMDSAKFYDTIIIGAGPSGLFAGAMLNKGRCLILEKNRQPGQKLLISGTGQCNFTHAGPIHQFLDHYGDNYRFLKPSFSAFNNHELIAFFGKHGIKAVEDKNGKIFPSSLKAGDILNTLLNICHRKGVVIATATPAQGVEKTENAFIVKTQDFIYQAKNLLITTGGLSYPSTGSTGDGYRFAALLGHTIIETRPALCPVIIHQYSFAGLSGVSIDAAEISIYRNNQKIKSHKGDIGFTLNGLTGPGILDFSRNFKDGDTLKINLCGMNGPDLEQLFKQTADSAGKTPLHTFLKKTGMPRSLMLTIIEQAGIHAEKPLAEISKSDRIRLVKLCSEFPCVIEKTAGYKRAMATAGGVSTEEISPKTMQSRLIPHLYFAGEVLDIDGDTGGYNLQAAFSTAFLAAQSINKAE